MSEIHGSKKDVEEKKHSRRKSKDLQLVTKATKKIWKHNPKDMILENVNESKSGFNVMS